jgi:hypothetical protein
LPSFGFAPDSLSVTVGQIVIYWSECVARLIKLYFVTTGGPADDQRRLRSVEKAANQKKVVEIVCGKRQSLLDPAKMGFGLNRFAV